MIICGSLYDTHRAERLAQIPCPNEAARDDTWHETFIYRTPGGRYFLAGCGGPLSLWGRRRGDRLVGRNFGFRALTEDQAREYLDAAS